MKKYFIKVACIAYNRLDYIIVRHSAFHVLQLITFYNILTRPHDVDTYYNTGWLFLSIGTCQYNTCRQRVLMCIYRNKIIQNVYVFRYI